jgi:hypothetical protein
MKFRVLLLAVLTVTLAAVPDGQAFGRRRARSSSCGCPPAMTSPCAPFGGYSAQPGCCPAPGYYPAPFGAPQQMTPPGQPRAVSIRGRTHHLYLMNDPGENDREELDTTEAGPLSSTSTGGIPKADVFKGTSRRVAKTIILNAPVVDAGSVAELFTTGPDAPTRLQSSQHMIAKHIAKGPNVNRVPEERRNVRVSGYIYAFRKEADNDYHVIIGDAPGTPNPKYLNVEVSGIPIGGSDENRQQLWAVRNAFKETFGLQDQSDDAGLNSYFRPHPPVPVRIAGSIFWDCEHEPPHTVGPNDFKPLTAWEIHPISELAFLD